MLLVMVGLLRGHGAPGGRGHLCCRCTPIDLV